MTNTTTQTTDDETHELMGELIGGRSSVFDAVDLILKAIIAAAAVAIAASQL